MDIQYVKQISIVSFFFIITLTLVQSVTANSVVINSDKILSIDGVRTFPVFASDLSNNNWGTADAGIKSSAGYITASWVSWRDNPWKIDPWSANALLPSYEATNPRIYTTSAIMTCPSGSTCYLQTQPNMKNSPAFFGYVQFDEPHGGTYSNLNTLTNNYNVLHADDPNHPVFLNLYTTRNADVVYYENSADAISWDIYTITSNNNRPDFLYIWESRSIINGFSRVKPTAFSKPLYTWLQANGVEGSDGNRIFYVPTPVEIRAELYDAVALGVNGIQLWSGHCCGAGANDSGLLANPSLFNSVKNILAEVHSLNKILILPSVGNSVYNYYDDITVSFSPNPSRVVSGGVGTMRALSYILKRDSSTGALYLIVVNKDVSPQNGILMTINGLSGSTTATTLGSEGSRTLQVYNGHFTDSFNGFGVHIYQIGGGSTYVPPTYIQPPTTTSPPSNGNTVDCTFTISPAGTGTVSANGIYVPSTNVMTFPYDAQVSFRAYPIAGYKFSHWLSMDGTVSYDNPYNDIMGGVDSKVAYFVPDTSYTPPVVIQQQKYISIFDFLIRWIQSYLHI